MTLEKFLAWMMKHDGCQISFDKSNDAKRVTMDLRVRHRGEILNHTHVFGRIELATAKYDVVSDRLDIMLRRMDERIKEQKHSNDHREIDVGPDGRCLCNCGDKCPLGRMGMQYRCTVQELAAAGINCVVNKQEE